ncbi:hypothetical protein BGW42_003068 [Actinomortierella wolfii]|nr:hypothetical protein BGW42_003068 [Actinomortierella wolfii]
MGQNTSQELPPNVPYHEKHYIENNKQLQRQSSLSQLQRQNSQSSGNLLLSRESSLKRADSNGGFGNSGGSGVGSLLRGGNQSMPSLNSPTSTGPSIPGATGAASTANGTGTSSSFIRLLPIETEEPYYDDDEDEDDDDDDESEEDLDEGEEGMIVDGHAGHPASPRGDASAVGHNSHHTSPHSQRQKRHQRRSSRQLEVDNDHNERQRFALSSSPSDYDKAMNANSRLSRSDSLEHHDYAREVLDDEQTRAEEAEDLAFLSPGPGHTFDSISSSSSSNHPAGMTTTTTRSIPIPTTTSLSRSGSGSSIIRYQLHDEPVRKNLESSRVEGGLRRGVGYGDNEEDEEEGGGGHRRSEGQDNDRVDQDEEDREDQFLRRHYASLGMHYIGGGGGGGGSGGRHQPRNHAPVHLQNDEYSDTDDSDDSDQDVLVLDEDDEDEYREVEMNQLLMEDSQQQQHDIQLLSGSLSVRSPFLDSIQEEEEEEGDSAFPPRAIAASRLSSSVPTMGSMFMGSSSSSTSFKSGLHRMTPPDLDHSYNNGRSPGQPSQPAAQGNQRSSISPPAIPSALPERPRGPRPPMMGRPRSNSSLTRLVEAADQEVVGGSNTHKDDHLRPSSSLSDTVQDLEVKRVMEGHPATADLATLPASSSSRTTNNGVSHGGSHVSPSSSLAFKSTQDDTKDRSGDGDSNGHQNLTLSSSSSARQTPVASFGQDTQRSIDEFFGLVKQDLEERIQQAIQAVEQKFLDRVHKLEERNALLTAAALSGDGGSIGDPPAEGSLMASLTRPLPPDQNPGGSVALRKEILKHVTEKVGDLDLRVNQMEVLVSYKLVDIESKVQDLHGAHNSIVQKVHQVAKTQGTKITDTEAGDGLGTDSIKAGEAKLEKAMQPYRLSHVNGDEDDGSMTNSSALVSPRAVMELRQEVAALGSQYRDLNDGLLTDLLSQMRDAKLMLLQTVDEVDNRISKRVDRIEAEMHARLLTEIEGRVQERVRALEQTLSRLEHCFDKTNGRLGALETTLASKQRPPRSDGAYQLQHHQNTDLSTHRRYDTIAGDGSTPHRYQHSVASLIFSDMDLATGAKNAALLERPASAPIRPPLLHSNSSTPDSPLPSGQGSQTDRDQDQVHHEHEKQQQRHSTWDAASSSSATPMPTTPSEEVQLVASPLERGTMIGGKHATIHSHESYNSRPSASSLLAPLSSTSTTSTTTTSSLPKSTGLSSRRVSMPSLDTKSATSSRGSISTGSGYNTITASTPTSRATMKRAMSMDTTSGTIRPSQVLASGGIQGLLVSPTSSTSSDSLKSPTSATSGGDIKHKLLGHGQGTKAGVKNPSSYRELLHFWKAGGSTPNLLKGV